MPKTNYRLLMEKELEAIRKENRCPRLLLHVCCAPCSSGCLEELCEVFRVTCFYCNPNISPEEEHDRRAAELNRLVSVFPLTIPPEVSVSAYEPERFREIARGLEDLPEDTALQRSMKAFMRAGGRVGIAEGVLARPFQAGQNAGKQPGA